MSGQSENSLGIGAGRCNAAGSTQSPNGFVSGYIVSCTTLPDNGGYVWRLQRPLSRQEYIPEIHPQVGYPQARMIGCDNSQQENASDPRITVCFLNVAGGAPQATEHYIKMVRAPRQTRGL